MFCKNCSATYPNDASNCPYCGSDNPEYKPQSLLRKKEISNIKTESFELGTNSTFHRITLVVCSLFVLLLIGFGGVTYYLTHVDEWQRAAAISGKNYEKNLATINSYLDEKNYLRAYTFACSSSPEFEVIESYPDIAEELEMLDCYTSFIGDIQQYIIQDCDSTYLYLSSYFLEPVHRLYTTTPTSTRPSAMKAELCKSIELYLKYYYRLTDQEIENLKNTASFYDYTIEGTTDFAYIINERMQKHENVIQ